MTKLLEVKNLTPIQNMIDKNKVDKLDRNSSKMHKNEADLSEESFEDNKQLNESFSYLTKLSDDIETNLKYLKKEYYSTCSSQPSNISFYNLNQFKNSIKRTIKTLPDIDTTKSNLSSNSNYSLNNYSNSLKQKSLDFNRTCIKIQNLSDLKLKNSSKKNLINNKSSESCVSVTSIDSISSFLSNTSSESISTSSSFATSSVTYISNYSDLQTQMNHEMSINSGWKIKEKIIEPNLKNRLIKGSSANKNRKKFNISCLNSNSSSFNTLSQSSTSFSSSLSDEYFNLNTNSSFKKKRNKSVALNYYHHLYNQKQKKIKSMKKSSPNILPLLYNKTIDRNHYRSYSNNFLDEIDANKDYKNEFSQRRDFLSNKLKKKKSRSIEDLLDLDHSFKQFSSSSPSSTLALSTTTSISSSSTSSIELKRIKFRNNGSHISLEEELNKISLSNENNNGKSSLLTNFNRNLNDLFTSFMNNKRNNSNLSRNKYSYKSCSPPRRKSQFDSKYKSLTHRTVKNFGKRENSLENNINTENLIQGSTIQTNVVNHPVQLSIDTKKTGGGLVTAEIMLNERSVKFDLKQVDQTKYELRLLPRQVGVYKLHLYLNNQAIKGSPFSIKIDSIDHSNKTNSTSIINNTTKQSLFTITDDSIRNHTRNFDTLNESNLSSNSSKKIKTELFDLSNKSEDLIVGEEVKLNVKVLEYENKDKMKNYIPNIETKVKFNDKYIDHKLDVLSNGLYQIKFLPSNAGTYFVSFYKDGQKIEDSPYMLNIKGRFLREIIKPNFSQVGVPYILNIDYCNTTNLKAVVYTEKNKSDSLILSQKNVTKLISLPVEKVVESDSKMRLKFFPLQPVEHFIDIIDNGVSIEGFPIKLNVFPNKEVYVVNENINGVILGDLAKFRICLNEHKDDLNVKITNIDSNEGQYASFLLNNEYQEEYHIFGALCKFLKINSNMIIKRQINVENGKTRVNFYIIEEQFSKKNSLKELKEIIENEKFVIIDLIMHKTIRAVKDSFKYELNTFQGPKGQCTQFTLNKQSNNKEFDYLGEFRPNSVGRYRIDIENFNRPINNSPFFVNVFDSNSIKIINLPNNFIVGTENLIEFNLTKCDYKHFEFIIESPYGVKLPYKIDFASNKTIRFIPRDKGLHKLYLKIGTFLVNEVPYEINAIESNRPLVYGNGLYYGIQNTFSIFYIQIPSNIDGTMYININDKMNNKIKSYITKLNDYLYEVKYLPIEIGSYKIDIKFNHEQVSSGPFTANIINPYKVKIVDEGDYFYSAFNNRNINLDLNEEKTLCFDATEAGPGLLNFDIIAPNNEKLPFNKKEENNLYKITFNPIYEGQYKIHVRLNNQEISLSPIVARTNDYSLLNEIKVYGNGIYSAELFQEAEFYVDCTKIKDLNESPEITFLGFSDDDKELKIDVSKIAENVYKCTYVAEKPGYYLINVKFNKRNVSGSPYEVKIGVESNPSRVIIQKDDLKFGIVGQELTTVIDTKFAGTGKLSASCLGSNKLALCHFVDRKDGTYLLKITPQEIGKHIINIKYNNINVPGSPFTFRVSAPPDASKVEVIGPGVCHGIIKDFDSIFVCDTKGAGAGQLTVRIRGPKGGFRVEMNRKDEKDRTIICKYDPIESGEYQINVKWSGQHVTNSPFNVKIFKTKEELNKFLNENPNFKKEQDQKINRYLKNHMFKRFF